MYRSEIDYINKILNELNIEYSVLELNGNKLEFANNNYLVSQYAIETKDKKIKLAFNFNKNIPKVNKINKNILFKNKIDDKTKRHYENYKIWLNSIEKYVYPNDFYWVLIVDKRNSKDKFDNYPRHLLVVELKDFKKVLTKFVINHR